MEKTRWHIFFFERDFSKSPHLRIDYYNDAIASEVTNYGFQCLQDHAQKNKATTTIQRRCCSCCCLHYELHFGFTYLSEINLQHFRIDLNPMSYVVVCDFLATKVLDSFI